LENEGFLRLREASEAGQEEVEQEQERHYNYCDLFRYLKGLYRYKSVRTPTIVLMFLWAIRFLIYFGLNLSLSAVIRNNFWLTFTISISSFAEVFGTFGLRTCSPIQR